MFLWWQSFPYKNAWQLDRNWGRYNIKYVHEQDENISDRIKLDAAQFYLKNFEIRSPIQMSISDVHGRIVVDERCHPTEMVWPAVIAPCQRGLMKELEPHFPADRDEEDTFKFDRLRLCFDSSGPEDMQKLDWPKGWNDTMLPWSLRTQKIRLRRVACKRKPPCLLIPTWLGMLSLPLSTWQPLSTSDPVPASPPFWERCQNQRW